MPKVVQQTGVKVGLDASKYKKNLKGMKQDTTQYVNSMCSSFGKLALSFAGVAGVTSVFKKVSEAVQEMERSVSSLSVVTGNLATARAKFEELNGLSRELPQSFDEITQATLTLNKAGLSTTNQNLTSLSAIALGTGKSLETVAQAVSNASLGQLKGLRQLGITATQEGDKIKLTYQGVTETINANTSDLQNYIDKLAQNKFGDVLSYQMNGVTGQVKRLGEAWGDLWRAFGEQGGGELIVSVLKNIWQGLDKITEWVNSEQFTGMIEAWKKTIDTFFDAFSDGWNTAKELVNKVLNTFDVSSEDVTDACTGYFSDFFTKVAMGVSIVAKALNELTKLALSVGERIGSYLDEKINGTLREKLAKADAELAVRQYKEKAGDDYDPLKAQAISVETYNKSMSHIIDNAPRSNFSDDIAKMGDELTKFQDELAKTMADKVIERRIDNIVNHGISAITKLQDATKQGVAITSTSGSKGGSTGSRKAGKSQEEIEVDNIRKAYERLKEAINQKNEAQLSEIDRENQEYASQLELLNQALNKKIISQQEYYSTIETLEAQHLSNLTQLQNEHYAQEAEQREAEIAKISEMNNYWGENSSAIAPLEQFTEKLNRYGLSWNDMLSDNAKMAKMSTSQIAGMYSECSTALSNYFGNMASGFEQSSGIYQGLFAVQKGFAVASSMISIYQGVANALAAPYPQNLVAWMGVLAQGMSIISQLKSVNYSGAYDTGGYIPSGSYGIVGEVGPEIVTGPANVTSRKTTEDLLSNSKSNITVNLIEDSSRAGQVEQTNTDEETIINVIVANIRSGGDVDGALTGTYGLSRQGA